METTMAPISVLLVDDNPTFLRILGDFLGEEEDILVVGMARSGEEALVKAKELRPQVILLDLAMPGLNGFNAAPRLRSMMPDVGIIALTVLDANGYREAALTAGADDFVAKANLNTHLVPAIRRVVESGRSGRGSEPTLA
jgi:DNA-binding NarL/FixJ family response regulator